MVYFSTLSMCWWWWGVGTVGVGQIFFRATGSLKGLSNEIFDLQFSFKQAWATEYGNILKYLRFLLGFR